MKYQEVEIKIIYLESVDVIMASGEHSDWNDSFDNVIDGWGN